MSALAALLDALAKKPPDVRADFVGHLAFDVMAGLDMKSLPADMRADLDRFIDRAGFEEDDSVEKTRARIDAHFQAHPLDKELLALFDALEANVADAETAQAADAGRAASAALGTADSKKPVGAEGRKAGTMAGGLMGLLSARTAGVAPSSTPPAGEPPRSTNPAPPGPNPPFSR